jgi:hypothetical protein
LIKPAESVVSDGATVNFDDAVCIPLNDVYLDYVQRRLTHKDTSFTYDNATDSLEAISDKITVVDTQTDILADVTNGNAAIKTAVNARSTPADVLAQVLAALETAVSTPTAKSLWDMLCKDASLTYDKSTDSLEAIRDRLDAIEGAAGTATIQGIYDKVLQQKIGRSAQSGSTTMTGSEQTLYEQSSTVPWKFEGGRIDLSGLADTRSVTIRFYQKCKSGGTYRLQSTVVLTGAADAALYEIPMQLPIGGTSYKAVLPGVWNTFGLKVTAQQTVAGAGNLTIDHEWMDSKS